MTQLTQSLKWSFSHFALVAQWARDFLVVRGGPVCCALLSTTPGVYPLDISNVPLIVRTENDPSHCQLSCASDKVTLN